MSEAPVQVAEALRGRSHLVVPLLAPDDVTYLSERYHEIVGADGSGIQIDFIRDDRAVVRALYDVVRPVLAARVPEVLADVVPVACSFVAKYPDESSALFLHRDMPVNDERTGPCFTLWSPLVDVSPRAGNGCLYLVPGSSELPAAAMGPTTPLLHAPYLDELMDHRVEVPMRAGEAMVFDTRTLHGSAPNRSGVLRLAVGCVLARSGAPLVRIHPTGRTGRQVVAVDADYFVDRHPLEPWDQVPEGYTVIDAFDDDVSLSSEEFRARFLGEEPPRIRPQVPGDLQGDQRWAAWGPLQTGPPVPVAHPNDLAVSAGSLPDGGDPPGASCVASSGSFAVVHDDDTISAVLEGRADLPGAVALVVLDPGARLELHCGAACDALVIEAPRIRSGARTQQAAAMLDLGDSIRFCAGDEVQIWNDGPGVVALTWSLAPLDPAPARTSGNAGLPGACPDA